MSPRERQANGGSVLCQYYYYIILRAGRPEEPDCLSRREEQEGAGGHGLPPNHMREDLPEHLP